MGAQADADLSDPCVAGIAKIVDDVLVNWSSDDCTFM